MLLTALLLSGAAVGAKVHVITFGKWISVQWFAGPDSSPRLLKVRPLLVDAHVKEYVTGSSHEITDRLFVVRRAFRMNDALPDEFAPRWRWHRGTWLLVDRVTGRISPVNLPAFDPYFSAASWYRDYTAYCGIGDDGKKTYAVVAQLSRRKPILKKLLPITPKDTAGPDSLCPAPEWQREPARVAFSPGAGEKQTFSVRGTAVDLLDEEEEEE